MTTVSVNSSRRELILNAAIQVFGRFGFKKTTVDDLAETAQISKPGLYLHFSSKEEVFVAAMQKYLDDGPRLVHEELTRPDTSLFIRLMGAMDVWFGRHLTTFTQGSFDVIEAGDRLSGRRIEQYKSSFQEEVRKAPADSIEFRRAENICTPEEVAQVLFLFGLTWKEGHLLRSEFMKTVATCIRACCQIKG